MHCDALHKTRQHHRQNERVGNEKLARNTQLARALKPARQNRNVPVQLGEQNGFAPNANTAVRLLAQNPQRNFPNITQVAVAKLVQFIAKIEPDPKTGVVEFGRLVHGQLFWAARRVHHALLLEILGWHVARKIKILDVS